MGYREVSEIRDGMRIDWDMPVEMEDGVILRADIYRPVAKSKYPVILTYGPYGKWLHFEDLYDDQNKIVIFWGLSKYPHNTIYYDAHISGETYSLFSISKSYN